MDGKNAAVAAQFTHLADSFRLIGFDAQHDVFHADMLLYSPHTRQNILRAFQHGAVVRSDIGFAFRSIDHQVFRLLFRLQLQLNPGWKTGAAQTYQSGGLHRLDKILGRGDGGRTYFRTDLLSTVGFDDGDVTDLSGGSGEIIDGRHRTGNAGMDGRRQKGGGFPDFLPHQHPFSLFDDAAAGRAQVLLHGNGYHRRQGHVDDGTVFRILGVGDTDAPECFCAQQTQYQQPPSDFCVPLVCFFSKRREPHQRPL